MKAKPATLNAKDIALIKIAVQDISLPLNRDYRKKLRDLEKEIAKLKKEKAVMPNRAIIEHEDFIPDSL
ncbi:MAG TPA: hypothetical protein VK508_01845 [Cyclobacteriaceae bacterium]|nr:hypothetical protein [Cyclobacteriaceae bacterium]